MGNKLTTVTKNLFSINQPMYQECQRKSRCRKSVHIRSFSGPYFPKWIWRDTEYLSVFSPNAGKYEPENSEFEHFSRSVNLLVKLLTTTIMDIIFRDFLIFYQIFFSPQVKRSVIISNKHGIYALPHKLPHDLRILGN